MQQEHEAEDQREGRFLDLPKLLAVAEVRAFRFEVVAEPAGDVGECVLDKTFLESLAQLFAEVPGFLNPGGEPTVLTQRIGGEEAEIPAVPGFQLGHVYFEVLAGGRSDGRFALEEAFRSPRAPCLQGVRRCRSGG